jgi:superfamily II DNA or RNA helicase
MKIIVDSNRAKIEDCPRSISKMLYEKLAYRHPEYYFSTLYQAGKWDGYIRKFSKATNSFPPGLLHRALFYIKRTKQKVTVLDKRILFKINHDEVLKNIDEFALIPRPYQIDGLLKGVYNPYMIFWWATAAGKTVEFSLLISAFRKNGIFRKTLIIVSTIDLAQQHKKDLEFFLGTEIGLIMEGNLNIKPVTVAVINTLWHKGVKQKKLEVRKYLNGIEHLILDETHHAIESKMMKQTIKQCKKTRARHGFSGSPYSLTIDDKELESITGPVLSKVTMSHLIQEGWVSKPIVTIIDYDADFDSSSVFQIAYKKYIVENTFRNNIIVEKALYYYNKGNKTVLILIKQIKHGLILLDMLKDKGVEYDDVDFIHGSSSKSKRNEAKERFEKKDIKILIASSIWNEGINVPTIDVMIKADGGGAGNLKKDKGIRSLVQQIGRVIRKSVSQSGEVDLNKESFVHIYDFNDVCHKDLMSQSKNRILTYELEPEYIIKREKYA